MSNQESQEICKPIFIVGVPRSGTSIFYEKLSTHPDLAPITQTSKKFPRSVPLTRLFSLVRNNQKPTEAPRIWRRFTKPENDVLNREDVTQEQRQFYHEVARAQIKIHQAKRFLAKYPRNALRFSYLDEIFPGCIFIHVLRDVRAVARSILQMRELHGGAQQYWGVRPPGWEALKDLPPLEAIAHQWKITIQYARDHAGPYAPNRYHEIRYEDFCDAPTVTLQEVGDTCGLTWNPEILEETIANVQSQNHKWRESFSPADIERMKEIGGDLLQELNYEL